MESSRDKIENCPDGWVRVGTYNIRHAEGLDGKVDLERICQVIRAMSVDIIGLQEVDKNWKRSGNLNQAACLAQMNGMNYCFAPGFRRGLAEFGNAVLSRHPILFWEAISLKSLRENRVLLRAVIEIGGRRFNFFTTHLGLNEKERLGHIEKIILPAMPGSGRTVLAGDFNCRPESPELRLLGEKLGDSSPSKGCPTFPSNSPTERIDYVMYSGHLEVKSIEVFPQDASDHNPVAVTFV